ncbi:CBS domain-containing protein [Echinimonas agarilytica]|uniref:CBS domain-containing protein n=1 Tax=Echinimonas agarilytica TaxID=1215918 RepID=A0AA42BAG8_9GAMM|nr:CBS domain-containing protein [Echinimonas agarilytica]MCM2681356.1 CBS domain-containing protein [Echinimonas agarilytica]
MPHNHQVRDFMHKHFPHMKVGTPLTETVDLLREFAITGTPVMDANKNLKGFVSEQDCIRVLISASYFCDTTLKVDDVMNNEPLSVSPDMGLIDLAQQMVHEKPKIYPVVEDGKVIGVISRSDVMAALGQSLKSCVPI